MIAPDMEPDFCEGVNHARLCKPEQQLSKTNARSRADQIAGQSPKASLEQIRCQPRQRGL